MVFSPLIGVYCGVNSPGIITSTHSTGALTFNFHADEGVTANGWEAIISCNGSTAINNLNAADNFQIYPNPSTGIVFVKTNDQPGELSVCDMLGREMMKQILHQNEKTEIHLDNLLNGMYQIKIKTSGSIAMKKIVLNKKQ